MNIEMLLIQPLHTFTLDLPYSDAIFYCLRESVEVHNMEFPAYQSWSFYFQDKLWHFYRVNEVDGEAIPKRGPDRAYYNMIQKTRSSLYALLDEANIPFVSFTDESKLEPELILELLQEYNSQSLTRRWRTSLKCVITPHTYPIHLVLTGYPLV